MTIYAYQALLNEDRTPYLAKTASYDIDGRNRYNAPYDLAEFIKDSLQIQHCAEEYLYVLCLNCHNSLIGLFEASHGSIDTSIASTREIMQKALLLGAVKIALTHNHPSADPEPSSLDIRATQDIKRACEILGLQLIDHIIVTTDSWYSMSSADML